MESIKKQFYSVEDVVHMTGLSKQTVYNLVRNGKLPAIQIGKKYFFHVTLFDQCDSLHLSFIVPGSPTT